MQAGRRAIAAVSLLALAAGCRGAEVLADPESTGARAERIAYLARAGLAPGERVWVVTLLHPAWNAEEDAARIGERLSRRLRPVGEIAEPGAHARLWRVAEEIRVGFLQAEVNAF